MVWLSGDPEGPDRYFRFVSQAALPELRERLADAGFPGWSLDLSQPGRVGVHVLVEGDLGEQQIAQFENNHQDIIDRGSDVVSPGKFGIIGGETREEAAELYRRIIEQYESRFRRARSYDPEKQRQILEELEERRKKALALVPPGPNASWEEKKMYAIRRAAYGDGRPVDLEAMERLDMRISMNLAHSDAAAKYSGEEWYKYPSVVLPLQGLRKRGLERPNEH